ncbi:hypothetical protein A2U01_0061467 [Trifolium medium]|uniref:Transmembrane protein n=1 Tax=Trifolium medium TaxID=97028 RepID=A0A392RX96_9FABA|nr:hypothetical protein [Trifolium medium]
MASICSSLLVFFFVALMLAPQGLAGGIPVYPIRRGPPFYRPPPHKKPPILNKKAFTPCTRDPTRPCYPPRRPPLAEDHNIHF